MSRQVTVTLYQFDELTDTAKERARDWWRDGGLDHKWWDCVYEDAERAGLKITGFNLDRGGYCEGNFILSACEVAANIFRDHGEMCETYKTAAAFMAEWQPVFDKYMDENDSAYESWESEDKLQELEDEFLKSLLEDYRIILGHEYDWLNGDEQVDETIRANEYEFTADGARA